MSLESDLTYLHSLGANESVLTALYEDTKDDFVIVELPFLELASSNNKSFTVNIAFNGNSVNMTLRKDLSDNEWWITEEGTVNGDNVNYIQRYTLDSFLHKHASYTYIIVSPYKYDSDDNTLSGQCIANSSLLIKY